MYKLKYEKYKEKYLALRHNLKGGKSLVNLLYNFDNNDFIKWYTYKIDDGFNAYEIFKDSFFYDKTPLAYQLVEQPLSILVGATNMNTLDYNRFKDSKLYTLYIGEKDSTNVEKQYDMYTIGYQNIFSNMGLYLKEFVRQIHFDTGVTYFCSIDYLKLAENILIKGGKIVFDLRQHMSTVYFFDRDLNIFTSEGLYAETLTKEEIEDKYNISIDIKTQIIISRIKNSRYGRNYLSPQIQLSIIDKITQQHFKKDPYRGYIDYCTKEYPTLRFEEKTYSFSNYTYPVPIRTINEELHIYSYCDTFDFIVNYIMTLDERIHYIKYNVLSVEKIDILIDRLFSNRRLLELFKIKINLVRNTDRMIEYFIYDELIKRYEYIEGIKI